MVITESSGDGAQVRTEFPMSRRIPSGRDRFKANAASRVARAKRPKALLKMGGIEK